MRSMSNDANSGAQRPPVRSGDIVAAPAGTQAHQLINTGSNDLRYLGISTIGGVDVVDYPDSKKIAVAAYRRRACGHTSASAHQYRLQRPALSWSTSSTIPIQKRSPSLRA